MLKAESGVPLVNELLNAHQKAVLLDPNSSLTKRRYVLARLRYLYAQQCIYLRGGPGPCRARFSPYGGDAPDYDWDPSDEEADESDDEDDDSDDEDGEDNSGKDKCNVDGGEAKISTNQVSDEKSPEPEASKEDEMTDYEESDSEDWVAQPARVRDWAERQICLVHLHDFELMFYRMFKREEASLASGTAQ